MARPRPPSPSSTRPLRHEGDEGRPFGGNGTVDYSFGFAGFDTDGFSTFGYRIPRLRFAVPWELEPDSAKRFGLNGRVGVNVADSVRLELGGATGVQPGSVRRLFRSGLLALSRHALAGRTSWLNNVYSRLIADTGPLRSTVTVYANRTDRASQNVSYGQFGVFCGSTLFTGSAVSTCRQDTFFIGDRKGFEYQGDLKLGAFGLFTFGAKAEQEQADSFSQIVLPTPALAIARYRGRADNPLGLRPAPDHAVRPPAPHLRRPH